MSLDSKDDTNYGLTVSSRNSSATELSSGKSSPAIDRSWRDPMSDKLCMFRRESEWTVWVYTTKSRVDLSRLVSFQNPRRWRKRFSLLGRRCGGLLMMSSIMVRVEILFFTDLICSSAKTKSQRENPIIWQQLYSSQSSSFLLPQTIKVAACLHDNAAQEEIFTEAALGHSDSIFSRAIAYTTDINCSSERHCLFEFEWSMLINYF